MGNSKRLEKANRTRSQYHGGTVGEGRGVTADVQQIANELFPDFRKMGHEYFYADVVSRPGLTLRERHMIIIAALQTIKFQSGTRGHMRYALDVGMTREEVLEVITHVAPYAGWPVGVKIYHLIQEVYFSDFRSDLMKPPERKPLSDDSSQSRLSAQERSMITMAALLTLKLIDRLKAEMHLALDIGISQDQILEVILQATPYVGWSAGVGAISAAKDVFSSQG